MPSIAMSKEEQCTATGVHRAFPTTFLSTTTTWTKSTRFGTSTAIQPPLISSTTSRPKTALKSVLKTQPEPELKTDRKYESAFDNFVCTTPSRFTLSQRQAALKRLTKFDAEPVNPKIVQGIYTEEVQTLKDSIRRLETKVAGLEKNLDEAQSTIQGLHQDVRTGERKMAAQKKRSGSEIQKLHSEIRSLNEPDDKMLKKENEQLPEEINYYQEYFEKIKAARNDQNVDNPSPGFDNNKRNSSDTKRIQKMPVEPHVVNHNIPKIDDESQGLTHLSVGNDTKPRDLRRRMEARRIALDARPATFNANSESIDANIETTSTFDTSRSPCSLLHVLEPSSVTTGSGLSRTPTDELFGLPKRFSWNKKCTQCEDERPSSSVTLARVVQNLETELAKQRTLLKRKRRIVDICLSKSRNRALIDNEISILTASINSKSKTISYLNGIVEARRESCQELTQKELTDSLEHINFDLMKLCLHEPAGPINYALAPRRNLLNGTELL